MFALIMVTYILLINSNPGMISKQDGISLIVYINNKIDFDRTRCQN